MSTFLFFCVALSFLHFTTSLPSIEVAFSAFPTAATSSNPDSPDKISATTSASKITHVGLPPLSTIISTLKDTQVCVYPDPSLRSLISATKTMLFLSVSSDVLPILAKDPVFALQWVYSKLLRYYPRYKMILISVGDAVFHTPPREYHSQALLNLHRAFNQLSTPGSSVSPAGTAQPLLILKDSSLSLSLVGTVEEISVELLPLKRTVGGVAAAGRNRKTTEDVGRAFLLAYAILQLSQEQQPSQECSPITVVQEQGGEDLKNDTKEFIQIFRKLSPAVGVTSFFLKNPRHVVVSAVICFIVSYLSFLAYKAMQRNRRI